MSLNIITDFFCNECNKYFKSKASLNVHLSLSNKHLNKETKNYCKFCNKSFDTKFSYQRHETNCKEKPVVEQHNKNIELQNQLLEAEQRYNDQLLKIEETYKTQIKELEEKNKYKLKELNKEHEKEYNRLANDSANYKGMYYDIKDKLKEKEKQYNEISAKLKEYEAIKNKYEGVLEFQKISQPTFINNTNNHIGHNITNIISSFKPLTEEFISEQLYTMSPQKLATKGCSYIMTHAMNDSEIGINVLLLDKSRNTIGYKDKNNNIVRDKNSEEFINLLLNTTSKQECLQEAIEISRNNCKNLVGTVEFYDATDTNKELINISGHDIENKTKSKLKGIVSNIASCVDVLNQKRERYINKKLSLSKEEE